MKLLFTLFLALCLCGTAPLTALAAERENSEIVKTPSVQEEVLTASTREMTYNQVWINAGKYTSGSFTVKNPHTSLFTQTKGTVKIESNNPNAQVHIVVHDGINTILNKTIKPGNGDVTFSSQSNSSQYVVNYFVYSTSKTAGIRVNCWLY